MDWVNMLQQGAAMEEEASSLSELGLYSWHIGGNINRAITAFAPVISRISLSSISTTLSFRKLDSMPVDPDGNRIPVSVFDPGRAFYAPDKWTIASISGSISGAPLSLGGTTAGAANAGTTTPPAQIDDPLRGIGTPISPWPTEEPSEERTTAADTLVPPVLRQTFTLPNSGNTRFNIDYQISPTFASELQFMNSKWATFEDVDWEQQSILWAFGTNATINFRTDHSSGLFSNTLSITGNITLRDYFDINEDFFKDDPNVTDIEDAILRMRRQQFSQSFYQSSFSYSGRVQPFHADPVFRQTSITHSLRGTLVRAKKYSEEESEPDRPELRPQWISFDSVFPWFVKEETVDGEFIPGLNSHQLSANLAANIMDKSQSITLTANLPPLDEVISTNALFNIWITTTNVSFRMEKLTEITARQFVDKGKVEGDWVFRPIEIRETLRFQNIGSLTFNMTIDPEEEYEITSIRSTLTLWDLRVNYLANKVIRSEFIPIDNTRPHLGGSWRQDQTQEPELLSRELSISYSKSFRNIDIIRNWIGFNFNINTSVNYNLQQYTNSNFQFSTGLTFRIAGFLDLTLSATSNNSVIWRYFKDVPGMEELTFMYIDGPQNNVFTDLIDSFNFGDISKRERSGFKMQRFNLNAVHHLGDWTATLSVGMYPFRDTTKVPQRFEIVSDISFLVQWKPITEIKTDVRFDGKTERWTVE
jgi:hypothetical protein